MQTDRLVKKIEKDRKISRLLKNISKEEKAKKQERAEILESGRPIFIGQEIQPEKTVGQLTAEIEYYEYIVPALKNIEEHKKNNKAIIAEAKAEYEKQVKEPMKALRELQGLEQQLFTQGGRSNFWAHSRYDPVTQISKPLDKIATDIIGLATTEREREKKALANLKELEKKEVDTQHK